MKELVNLSKIFINTNLGLSMLSYNFKNDKKAFLKQAGIGIIVGVAMIPMFVLYVMYLSMLYSGITRIGQTSVFLPAIYTFVSLIIIIFGIAYVLSEFYFSSSVRMLLPLPVKPKNIIMGKFVSIIVIEILIAILMMLPPVIIYGMGQGMGILYYILALLVVITLPILPISIEILIMMLIMRGSSLSGKKDVIQVVSLFVLIFLIIGVEMYLRSMKGMSSDDPMALVSGLLSDNGFLLQSTTKIYPMSLLVAWGINTITPMGILSIGALIIITGASVFLMVIVGEKVYIRGLLSDTENQKQSKLMSLEKREKAIGKKVPVALAVFKTDIRLLLRTPIFLFNNVSVVIIIPFCLLISFTIPDSGLLIKMTQMIYENWPDLFNFIFIAFFMFLGGTTSTTATTFSREGKNIWLTRLIPVRAKDQIIGRCLSGLLIQILGVIFTIVLIIFFIPLSLGTIVISFVLGTLGSLPILLFGLLVDMKRPILNWDNPQRAVKNNLNVLISMLASIIYMILIFGISGAVGFFATPALGYGMFIGISSVVTILLYITVNKQMSNAFMVMN